MHGAEVCVQCTVLRCVCAVHDAEVCVCGARC